MQETSCGQFAATCVSTTARIITDASSCMDIRSNYSFVRNFTPKPLPTIEVRDGPGTSLCTLKPLPSQP